MQSIVNSICFCLSPWRFKYLRQQLSCNSWDRNTALSDHWPFLKLLWFQTNTICSVYSKANTGGEPQSLFTCRLNTSMVKVMVIQLHGHDLHIKEDLIFPRSWVKVRSDKFLLKVDKKICGSAFVKS